jgi:hypothetical protein
MGLEVGGEEREAPQHGLGCVIRRGWGFKPLLESELLGFGLIGRGRKGENLLFRCLCSNSNRPHVYMSMGSVFLVQFIGVDLPRPNCCHRPK